MPRVIAGICGGIPLAAPRGEKTRPTADKVKEALFSVLQPRLYDASFLDLFSGSGQIGVEALSRGARRVVFVDKSHESREITLKNLEKTGLLASSRFICADVVRGLRELGRQEESFDIIYMDPPYDRAREFIGKMAPILLSEGILAPRGSLIVEHRSTDSMVENVMNLTLYRCCKYGLTMLTFYSTEVREEEVTKFK